MGVNQLVTESQAHKWYRQALMTGNGCWAKEEEVDIVVNVRTTSQAALREDYNAFNVTLQTLTEK